MAEDAIEALRQHLVQEAVRVADEMERNRIDETVSRRVQGIYAAPRLSARHATTITKQAVSEVGATTGTMAQEVKRHEATEVT